MPTVERRVASDLPCRPGGSEFRGPWALIAAMAFSGGSRVGSWARSAHWASSNIKNSQGLSAYVAFYHRRDVFWEICVGKQLQTIVAYCCASKTSKHKHAQRPNMGCHCDWIIYYATTTKDNMIGRLFWISMQETYTYLRAVLQLAPTATGRAAAVGRGHLQAPAKQAASIPPSSRSFRHPWATCAGRRRTGGPRAPPAESSAWALRRSCLFVPAHTREKPAARKRS